MRRLSGRFCKTAKAGLPLAAAALLAGCSSSDETELRGWMNGVKQATRVTSQLLAPHREYIPFVYNGGGAVEPFDPRRIRCRDTNHGDRALSEGDRSGRGG
jgi:Tfp pilus assembly protein PilP